MGFAWQRDAAFKRKTFRDVMSLKLKLDEISDKPQTVSPFGCFQKIGKHPKMDGEHNGKPY